MLVIGIPELYESRRLRQEGRRLGWRVDAAPFDRLGFEVGRRGRRVFCGRRDLFKTWDTLYFRYFYPYVSEALLLAEWASRQGLRIIDRTLTDRNFVQSKMYNYWKLSEAGLPVPSGFQVMNLGLAKPRLAAARWPVVAKGVHGSKGRYVFRLDSPADARILTDDLTGFFTFQEFVPAEAEYRVLVLGGRALGAMLKLPPGGDFRRNIAVGASGEPVDLPRPLLRLSERAARTLGYEFAGVDLALAGGRPVIYEVNRSPGFEGFEQATGTNVAGLFLRYAAKKKNR